MKGLCSIIEQRFVGLENENKHGVVLNPRRWVENRPSFGGEMGSTGVMNTYVAADGWSKAI